MVVQALRWLMRPSIKVGLVIEETLTQAVRKFPNNLIRWRDNLFAIFEPIFLKFVRYFSNFMISYRFGPFFNLSTPNFHEFLFDSVDFFDWSHQYRLYLFGHGNPNIMFLDGRMLKPAETAITAPALWSKMMALLSTWRTLCRQRLRSFTEKISKNNHLY